MLDRSVCDVLCNWTAWVSNVLFFITLMKQIRSRSHQQLSPQFHELISKRQLSVKPPHRLSYRPLISSLLPAAARSMLHPASTLELSSPQAAQCCTDLHALPLFSPHCKQRCSNSHSSDSLNHFVSFEVIWSFNNINVFQSISAIMMWQNICKYVCSQPGASAWEQKKSPVTKQILQNFFQAQGFKKE